ncbi:RagB/SusD family nutrient uptake outer membrane protein [Flammeovirga pectinis]|uniref:RagB/SusD family nutrient uptake outer membrane protein n=1 Tax=Flammeovirga pectinis TaxID=2494373 RepID=A0A3Q9FNI9_9BACT|nr:RagB/SusD family nutrient uptake outer membrane protein [Flammeovirga pectinis]AZQ62763.1 RagB/SusD family nutrient uptake outer membrane protein [Flammeovirga pectinis]
MKNILIGLTLLIGVSFFTSCQDSLDLEPKSAIGDNGFYKNTAEIEAAVFAMYDGLQNVVLREFALTEMRSDNSKTKNSEGEWAQFETMDVSPNNGTLSTYWTDLYNVVFRANKVLQNLDVVTSDEAKAQFEGEAKFVRALAYFNLTRGFGDVPLVTKIIVPGDEVGQVKVLSSSVLDQIELDLNDAISKLTTRGDVEEGRATIGAAQALLAKVKLTRGDYTGARTLLETIVGSGDYNLAGTYRDVFYSELNSEVIFAVQFLNDHAVESQDFSYEFTKLGRNSGLNYVTSDLVAAVGTTDTERIGVLYNPEDVKENGKFISSSSDNRLCGNDWVILRLADVYLMHSEAILAGQSETTDASAIASYNMIRSRVNLSTLATDGSAALTKEMLFHERRVELAFENHRLYDLVRSGEAERVMGDFASANGFTFNGTKLLLPIPQREIDTSFGILKQNPGY